MAEEEHKIGLVNYNQSLVKSFNRAIGAKADMELRCRLIAEEAQEVLDAIEDRDEIELIDGLCDLLYVTYGAADVLGINLDTAESVGEMSDGLYWGPIVRSAHDLRQQTELALKALRGLVIHDGYTYLAIAKELVELANGCWAMARGGMGIDLTPFFFEVHRTNMHKVGGPVRADGKGLKPEGWKPPRIESMYNRIMAKNSPSCDVVAPIRAKAHAFDMANRLPHPEGGWFCQECGGLFVLYELDYGMEIKLAKEGM